MKIENLDLTASDIATACHAFKLQYTNYWRKSLYYVAGRAR